MKIFYAYLFSLGGINFCSLATSLCLTLLILRDATLDGFWLNSLPSRRFYELEAATQCFFKQPPGLVLSFFRVIRPQSGRGQIRPRPFELGLNEIVKKI